MKAFPYDLQSYAVVSRDKLTAPIAVMSTGDWDQSRMAFAGLRGTVTFGTFTRELPDGVELTAIEQEAKAETIDRKPRASALDALVVALEELGLSDKRVGIDETVSILPTLPSLSASSKLKVVPAAALFARSGWSRRQAEVERLRHAAQCAEGASRRRSECHEGVTEREMYRAFQHLRVEQGGQPTFTLFRFGRNAALGQVPAGDTPLGRRPIWFDVGCLVKATGPTLPASSAWRAVAKLRTYYDAVLAGEDHGFSFAVRASPLAILRRDSKGGEGKRHPALQAPPRGPRHRPRNL